MTTLSDRDILLKALFAALPLRRIGENLYVTSQDIGQISDESLASLRLFADVALSKNARYRYGRGSLKPKGVRMSVVRSLFEHLEIGESSEYRGAAKLHLRKYLIAPATLSSVENVMSLGGKIV